VAVNDTIKTADLAERVDGDVIGAIITRVNRDTYVQEIADQFDVPLLGVIPVDVEATREEPLLENASGSDPADAYRQLAGSLGAVFFEGAESTDLDRVFDSQWFLDEQEDDDTDEDEEDGGVFGGIFG
jgi:septum site-determining protein MinD